LFSLDYRIPPSRSLAPRIVPVLSLWPPAGMVCPCMLCARLAGVALRWGRPVACSISRAEQEASVSLTRHTRQPGRLISLVSRLLYYAENAIPYRSSARLSLSLLEES